jgi:hypothetical protein
MKLIKYICILFRTLLIIYTKKVRYDTRVSFYTKLVIDCTFLYNFYKKVLIAHICSFFIIR